MAPFLLEGDRVLVARHIPLQFIKNEYVVLLESWPEKTKEEPKFLIKRVVGLPSTTLAIYRIKLASLEGIIEEDKYRYFSTKFTTNTQVTFLIDLNEKSNPLHKLESEERIIVRVPHKHLFVKGDWLMGGDDSVIRGPVPYNKVKGVMVIKLNS